MLVWIIGLSQIAFDSDFTGRSKDQVKRKSDHGNFSAPSVPAFLAKSTR
jgi:hypothetical protein